MFNLSINELLTLTESTSKKFMLKVDYIFTIPFDNISKLPSPFFDLGSVYLLYYSLLEFLCDQVELVINNLKTFIFFLSQLSYLNTEYLAHIIFNMYNSIKFIHIEIKIFQVICLANI